MTSRKRHDSATAGITLAQIALGMFGLIAPILTFFLAVSTWPETVKMFVLVVLALGYSAVCFWSFGRSRRDAEEIAIDAAEDADDADGLKAIGEAHEFFGSSLKPADLYRLVSSRVARVFPFENSALFVAGEAENTLKVAQADGPNAEALLQVELPLESGLAGRAWFSTEVELDVDLKLERAAMPGSTLVDSSSAAAIPLMHDGQAFGVLVLYGKEMFKQDDDTRSRLEAIGERVTPLFLSSIAFERSVANALTDTLTRLPNERAFYMVLENQLAESQRFRHERPLTIMTVDIKNFTEINQGFGYAAGDRMLAFTAGLLGSQLRKMDFLSRSSNDEFLIVLPTASEKFAGEIIERIRQRFSNESFNVTESDEIKVWLNFGYATFWQDGETADQLLQNARVRKQQSKAEEPSKVLWFPKEYVN